MNEIQTALLSLLPSRRKQTPSGWVSMNAVCCHHRGESPDTRSRGGLFIKPDQGWTYHCFNCGFKAGWSPGHFLSSNSKLLFTWLGLPESDVHRLGLEAIKLREGIVTVSKKSELTYSLEEKSLPDNCRPIDDWIKDGCNDAELLTVIEYILSRGIKWHWYPWYWSPENGYRDRVILPFYHDGKIVGWTGRKVTAGKPKYLTTAQPGYVFNIDRQTSQRQFVIVVEGQFDAIAIDGVAIMHNEPNDVQCARINALGREVIVVPDRDQAGAKLIKSALDNNWNISIPDWGADIKDVADAVQNYGRLYTLMTIIKYRESNSLKISILKKQLEQQHNEK